MSILPAWLSLDVISEASRIVLGNFIQVVFRTLVNPLAIAPMIAASIAAKQVRNVVISSTIVSILLAIYGTIRGDIGHSQFSKTMVVFGILEAFFAMLLATSALGMSVYAAKRIVAKDDQSRGSLD